MRWVFLDRDGTLNVPPVPGQYIERPEQLQLLPGAARGLAMLNRAGVWTGLATNQRGVALGRMSLPDLDAVHERLAALLEREGAFLDAIYACPHELGECACRKPHPGLLLAARAEQPAIDFARAAMVGDSVSDMQAGRALGMRTVLIARAPEPGASPGRPPDRLAVAEGLADEIVVDLVQAARLLIGVG